MVSSSQVGTHELTWIFNTGSNTTTTTKKNKKSVCLFQEKRLFEKMKQGCHEGEQEKQGHVEGERNLYTTQRSQPPLDTFCKHPSLNIVLDMIELFI